MCLHFEFKSEITKIKHHKCDLVVNGYNSEVAFKKTGLEDVECINLTQESAK
jgi:hypothetical protein